MCCKGAIRHQNDYHFIRPIYTEYSATNSNSSLCTAETTVKDYASCQKICTSISNCLGWTVIPTSVEEEDTVIYQCTTRCDIVPLISVSSKDCSCLIFSVSTDQFGVLMQAFASDCRPPVSISSRELASFQDILDKDKNGIVEQTEFVSFFFEND